MPMHQQSLKNATLISASMCMCLVYVYVLLNKQIKSLDSNFDLDTEVRYMFLS